LVAGVASCTYEDGGAAESRSSALNANPKVSDFALLASNSIAVSEAANVSGGDLGVIRIGSGPFLVSDFEFAIGEKGLVSTTRSILADSVRLGEKAVVGAVQTNHLTDKGA